VRFVKSFKYEPAPRQAVFRLSRQQRADLVSALAPHTLTRPLLETIEDALCVSRETIKRHKRAPKTIAAWQKRIRRGERLAQELRDLLPIVSKATEEVIVKDFNADADDDDALRHLLERRAFVWKRIANTLPPPLKHRPPNSAVVRLGVEVVTALDAAQVPLTLGRKTVVVEVLGLIYRWATDPVGRRRPDNRWSSLDYEFSRAVVESYLENPRS
jgi:hypothetical protein